MKIAFKFFIVLCLAFAGTAAFGQDVLTKGSIAGTVNDASGAAVPGATVKITGVTTTERVVTTNDQGSFSVENLSPGNYTVRVEMANFKTAEIANVTVFVGKTATQNVTLEAGSISETVNITAGAEVDQASTAISSNLNDQLFSNIPVARGVSSLFYLAPGTSDSLGGGKDNPSISGGSALDNLYVADGVNITDSAFGGIGTFSRSYGPLGTGINTSFVKEVQVKTAGFEPQYGQATGGIVNIITQSGGNEFHGAIYGYARPNAFEATRKQRDDFSVNKVGKILATEGYDAGVDVGGPIVKNKLFFFGSFNPSVRRDIVRGAQGSGLLTLLGDHVQRYRSYNYALKADWNITSNHSLAYSIYGDPTKTNVSSFATLNIDNTTANSKLDFGSRNQSLRYNGSLTPTWTLSASVSQSNNHFDESGFADFNQIVDRTGIGVTTGATRGQFTAIGRGFVEPTKGRTRRFSADTQKQVSFLGSHSFGVGYQFQQALYSGTRDRSGPHYSIPAANEAGLPLGSIASGGAAAIGQPVNVAWSLRVVSNSNPSTCPSCPVFFVPGGTDIGLGAGGRRVYLRQDRGEYGNPVFDTKSGYHAWYAQDTWRVNRFVTGLLGIRWETERVQGSPSAAGVRAAYSFTDNWAPRIGVTVDPLGKGTMKAYYNYGRFFEYLPLDLAERSLSAEQDFTGGRFAPAFHACATTVSATDRCANINSFGTVDPVYDSAHLLSRSPTGTGGGIGISFNDPSNPILSGTKLGFIDENVFGFETQLPKNFVFSARYINRNQKRIIEDAAVVSVEQFNAGLFGQTYFLANINKAFDRVINPIPHVYSVGGTVPAACFNSAGEILYDIPSVTDSAGNVLGAVCYEPNPVAGEFGVDGLPDGFPNPVHKYKALELELNKRFSDNWQLLSNWRIASLRGNYEGHLRNDNGQTDPGISSLFDFVEGDFNLLGDQFAVGPLNTDRRHIINIYGSYAFSKTSTWQKLNGLNLGFNFHAESGLPISEFLAHPAYLNAGEIPVGGRGKLGRTAFYPRFDFHGDYSWKLTEKTSLKFVGDLFNVFNTRTIRQPQEFRETSAGVNNVDFLQPRSFYLPFNMRLGVRFEF
ncbi:MAG TPA: TonB-dependent receptor [Pyrinomonadaceae bacterium]